MRQYSQNKQHSQYKKHHLFCPCKPLAWSKTTTHHSSNLDTHFYNLRELRSRFYSPFSNPNVCLWKEEGKLQTSCHSCKSEVTITHYHWKLKSGYNKHAQWSTEHNFVEHREFSPPCYFISSVGHVGRYSMQA